MRSLDNLDLRAAHGPESAGPESAGPESAGPESAGNNRRVAFHLPWQAGTASFRLMALLEDGSTMLVCLVENLSAVRATGEAAAKGFAAQRDIFWQCLRAGKSDDELIRLRPGVVSLYSERWAGSLTDGSWQPLADRSGGYYRGFRPLPSPNEFRRHRRRVRKASKHTRMA